MDLLNRYSSSPTVHRRKRWVRYGIIILVLGAGLWGLTHLEKTTTFVRGLGNNEGEEMPDNGLPKIVDDPQYAMPENDKSRLDILLLGIRGEEDTQNGGMLTDTIMVLSLDTETGKVALTSIPRDLTIRVTDAKTSKINEVYIYNGVNGTKRLYSRILGVYIDNVVIADFKAFQHIVDALGGITITLDRPFNEAEQWGYEFSLPAGENTLNGEQALYYVRSRYGSSDFDRARRQQQVMAAIKAKIEGLDLLSDPLSALQLINAVRKNIETDMNIFDIGTLKELMANGENIGKLQRYQLTTENLLYETKVDGIYELLPRDNTLDHIKEFFRTVLTDKPVLFTPTPTPAVSASVTP